MTTVTATPTLVRHEGEAPQERSTCGWRHLLISRQDSDVAAWVHAVDIDGAKEHYHKAATEITTCWQAKGSSDWTGWIRWCEKGRSTHPARGRARR